MKSILHVKGRSKRFTERCGCSVEHRHGSAGYSAFTPCLTHEEYGESLNFMVSEHHDDKPRERVRICGCELQYRGREGGTSFIPCAKHRSDFFAGLHRLGFLKEAEHDSA